MTITATIDRPAPSFERSLEQRRDALRLANRVRSARAEFKREAKAGRADVLAILRDPPADFLTMKAYDLLLAMPTVGRVKVGKALRLAAVSPSKTLGGLSERQRGELCLFLHGRAASLQSRVRTQWSESIEEGE